MAGQIAVLIDARLHNELVLRTRSSDDVSRYIEHAVETFLERTQADDMWSDEYLSNLQEVSEDLDLKDYGDPKKGYQWQALFLPNKTCLQITYKGRRYLAEIRHSKLIYEGVAHTPSEWARRVANNTNRNAWRDIWVRFPDASEWKLADAIRWASKEAQS